MSPPLQKKLSELGFDLRWFRIQKMIGFGTRFILIYHRMQFHASTHLIISMSLAKNAYRFYENPESGFCAQSNKESPCFIDQEPHVEGVAQCVSAGPGLSWPRFTWWKASRGGRGGLKIACIR